MSCSRTGTSMWSRCGRSRTVTVLPPSPDSQPPDEGPVEHVDVVLDHDHVAGLRRERHDVALADPVAGDVDPLAVDLDETVVHELAGLRAGGRPAGAVRRRCRGAARAGAAGSHPSARRVGWPPRRCGGTAARGRRRCTSPSASPAAGRGTRCRCCGGGCGRGCPAGTAGARGRGDPSRSRRCSCRGGGRGGPWDRCSEP